jgi:hypothetical protein
MRRIMVLLGSFLLFSNLASAQVRITFDADAAVATGITPGGDAVWFGVSRDREDWSDHFFHWRLTTADTDKDGIVRYPRKEGFPVLTALVVVDVASGEYALGTAYPREKDVPSLDISSAHAAPDGALSAFSQPGSRIDVLVVRGGVGAWNASVVDGGPLDQDGVSDGTVTIGFGALRPVGDKAARLDAVRPGDVVALGDPTGPWVRVTRVAGRGKE